MGGAHRHGDASPTERKSDCAETSVGSTSWLGASTRGGVLCSIDRGWLMGGWASVTHAPRRARGTPEILAVLRENFRSALASCCTRQRIFVARAPTGTSAHRSDAVRVVWVSRGARVRSHYQSSRNESADTGAANILCVVDDLACDQVAHHSQLQSPPPRRHSKPFQANLTSYTPSGSRYTRHSFHVNELH